MATTAWMAPSPSSAPTLGRSLPSTFCNTPGPLNCAEPLYNAVPLLIEDNPQPSSGAPYCYAVFFDNEAQSYFNMGQSSSYAGNMFGKYSFGALYGAIDCFSMAGGD